MSTSILAGITHLPPSFLYSSMLTLWSNVHGGPARWLSGLGFVDDVNEYSSLWRLDSEELPTADCSRRYITTACRAQQGTGVTFAPQKYKLIHLARSPTAQTAWLLRLNLPSRFSWVRDQLPPSLLGA